MTKDDDQAIAAFLAFLEKDIERRADKLSTFPPELAKTIAKLTANVDGDPDAPIESSQLLERGT